MDLSDGEVRRRLEIELFVGFNEDDPRDKIAEKLLQIAIVSEEKRAKDKAFFKSGDNSSEGEDDDKKDKAVTRIICVTSKLVVDSMRDLNRPVRKNNKLKLHKVKISKNATFSILKSWNLDDLRSMESSKVCLYDGLHPWLTINSGIDGDCRAGQNIQMGFPRSDQKVRIFILCYEG